MTKVKKYVDDMRDELDGAKHYIETALEYKAMGDIDRYNGYKTMSIAEIDHANRLHQYAVQDIEKLKSVYPEIPQEMLDKWNKAHIEYVEKAAWIKQMQSM